MRTFQQDRDGTYHLYSDELRVNWDGDERKTLMSESPSPVPLQKLFLRKRASGIHGVHAPSGELIGVVDPADLDLDPTELEELLRRHGQKAAAAGAVDGFLSKIRAQMKASGSTYSEAFKTVARNEPVLASEYRAEVLKADLL